MPFLLPAIGAAVCDVAIVQLCLTLQDLRSAEEGKLVYRTIYMLPVAIIRLVMLLAPLPYHSYTGTAVKCPLLYQLLYAGTLGLVLLHMLSLGMVDPTSLSTLIPTQSNNSEPRTHDMLTRHLWLLLGLTLLANMCHIILFLHVRSTAPANAELDERRHRVLFYFVREQGEDTELDSLLHGSPTDSDHLPLRRQNSNNSLNNRLQIMTTELLNEVQTRMKHTKKEWTKFLNDYRALNHRASNGQDLVPRQLSVFRVLLQLFAYEDVLQNRHLDFVYALDEGASLMFFVPQLLSFLLHGAYESSADLEEWVLETCERNIFFAHRCYWFLRAWCLEIQESADKQRHSRSNSMTSLSAGDIAQLDDRSLSSTDPNKVERKFLPEERAVLEGLLLRVMESGEKSARLKHFGTGQENDNDYFNNEISPSALMLAAEAGSIPVDPDTGMPSARHWDSYAAPRKFGFLPLDKALTNSAKPDLGATFFDATPLFLDSFIEIADNLFKVQKEKRPKELKKQLQALECRVLPSNSIYLPIRDSRHRVWRIAADESIAISTKERVPCIICLEVVQYSRSEVPQSRDVRKLFDRASKNESNQSIEERQQLHEWRFGHRDPHRRDAPLEKLAHTMRDGIRKIPISQMRTSVNDTMSKIRETNYNIREMLTLNVPESFDEENLALESPDIHAITSICSIDIERGIDLEASNGTSNGQAIPPRTPSKQRQDKIEAEPPQSKLPAVPSSPTSSKSTNPVMGQWASPSIHGRPPPQSESLFTDESLAMPPMKSNGARHRTSKGSDHQAYGANGITSKRVQNLQASSVMRDNRKPKVPEVAPNSNRKTKARPHPVVFKEIWHEKEERIRSKSVFGSHPGWKLIPILIKSNDDLRQEQLASQLIYRISLVLARERVPVWLCPYEILAITDSGGVIEAIPDTISLASLKKNDANYTNLRDFFHTFFDEGDDLAAAKANFCESLAAYSIVCFLLQLKDRHNGNILLDNHGHLIHIDFGFFFLSSPGKNTGFESAPFKLSREMVGVLGGPDSRLFKTFRVLCYRCFISLRRNCMEIILLIEMLKKGNEDLACFRGRPDDAIKELRQRFRLDLNDRACMEYVNALIDESLENWRTDWYDRYQRYCVGVL